MIDFFQQCFARQIGGTERWDRIVYLPGNHDHHLWETTREQAYAAQVAAVSPGEPFPTPLHATAVMDDAASEGTPFRSSLLDAVVRGVLAGKTGAARDVVALNAAAGLLVCGVVKSLEEGLVMALAAIDAGAARRTLEELARVSNER